MTNLSSSNTVVSIVTSFTAFAIVVANMVGVGVFTSLGFQVQAITSGFSLMLLWVIGGIVAFCGATCYAELASMFPRSSGEYNYLARAYHPAVGFIAGWLSATVGFSAPVALLAMAFGQYFKSIVPAASPLALAIGITWLVSVFHLLGIRYGSAFQNSWTVLKLALIMMFIIAGFSFSSPQPITFTPTTADFSQVLSGSFAISLAFVMYSYAGWNASTYIIGEIREPNRTLPSTMFAGVFIVMALYVALNAVFLYTTPIEKMSGQVEVALIVGNHIFGARGGEIVGALICLGLVSSISAMMWIGPRVTMVMGEDFPMLQFFARKSEYGVPSLSIFFQLAISNLLLLTKSFAAVLEFLQLSLALTPFFTVLGVIKLRYSNPTHPRSYCAWGYPVTPLIFLLVTFFMIYHLAINRPMQLLGVVINILAGLFFYGVTKYYRPQATVI